MTPQGTDQPVIPFAKSFGAFYPDALMVQLEVDPKEHLDPERTKAFRAGNPSIEDQVNYALAQVAVAHEQRHFHDAFGTRAGIMLFLAKFSVLQDFAKLTAYLTSRRIGWPLPIKKAKQADLPDEAWRFIQHAVNVKLACSRFHGDLPSVFGDDTNVPDPLPHYSQLKEDRLNTIVHAFPARVVRVSSAGTIAAIQHIPLAYGAILEGNAQVIQRTWLETLWGPEVAQRAFLLTGMTVRELSKAPFAPTYNVSDLMVTRYLQNNGIASFPRQALLALADHALADAAVVIKKTADGTRSVGVQCVGQSFVEFLNELGPKAIVEGKIPTPRDEGHLKLRDFFAGVGSVDAADREFPGMLADIEVLFRWVALNVVAPLLSARLETKHLMFSDLGVWLGRFARLPSAPFQIKPDGTMTSWAPPRVVDAWLRVRMIESMLAQLLEGAAVILCPRAHSLAPGISKVNYAHTGSCDDYVARELCGRYQPEIPDTLPHCRFRDALHSMRLLIAN